MNKKDMQERCRDIIRKGEVSGENETFIRDLLRHHPDATPEWLERVRGANITVGSNRYGTRSFYLDFANGTRSDVSWVKCVKNYRTLQ